MACFADINVSQGSVATYARCGGIFYIHLTATLLRKLPVKKIVNRLRFDRIMVMSLWPCFGAPCKCFTSETTELVYHHSELIVKGTMPPRINPLYANT